MTVVKMMPDKVRQACQTLKQNACQSGCSGIPGLYQSLLIESLDEPGRVVWLSTWDSLREARAFIGSQSYVHLVAAVQPYLLTGLQEYEYSVLEDLMNDQKNSQVKRV